MNVSVQVHLRLAWWFPIYLAALLTVCELMGRVPDEEKLQRWLKRAIVARVVA